MERRVTVEIDETIDIREIDTEDFRWFILSLYILIYHTYIFRINGLGYESNLI